jgi:hypothetical protein
VLLEGLDIQGLQSQSILPGTARLNPRVDAARAFRDGSRLVRFVVPKAAVRLPWVSPRLRAPIDGPANSPSAPRMDLAVQTRRSDEGRASGGWALKVLGNGSGRLIHKLTEFWPKATIPQPGRVTRSTQDCRRRGNTESRVVRGRPARVAETVTSV